jgi:hypothetical protein
MVISRDENGLDTDENHRYYICFHISVQIQIQNMDNIYQLCWIGYYWVYNITNMRFKYLDTDTVLDVEYPDSDTDTCRIWSRMRLENIHTI